MKNRLTLRQFSQLMPSSEDISLEDNEKFTSALFSLLAGQILKEEPVRWHPFGTFKKTLYSARKGINPSTGEELDIPSQYHLSFNVSSSLKKIINKDYAHLQIEYLHDDEPTNDISTTNALDSISAHNSEAGQDAGETEPPPVAGELPDIKETHREVAQEKVFTVTEEPPKKKSKGLLIGLVLLLLLLPLLFFVFKSGKNSPAELEEEAVVEVVQAPPPEEPLLEPEKPKKLESAASSGVITHTVKTGDSFYALAIEYWDSSKLWPVLYFDNREKFSYPDLLLLSQSILVGPKPNTGSHVQIAEAYQYTYELYEKLLANSTKPKNTILYKSRLAALRIYAKSLAITLQ